MRQRQIKATAQSDIAQNKAIRRPIFVENRDENTNKQTQLQRLRTAGTMTFNRKDAGTYTPDQTGIYCVLVFGEMGRAGGRRTLRPRPRGASRCSGASCYV